MGQITLALIWGDDHSMLLLTQYLCHEHGYALQYYTTFEAARELWKLTLPAVAIIKRSLSVTDDGLDFCAALRSDELTSRLPVIIGWADMSGQTFAEAYQVGANGCFGRVFDISGVFRMVELLADDPIRTGLVDQGAALD